MASPTPLTEKVFTANNHKTAYLTAGPESGPLLIFVHGWPATKETWTPQLKTFASLGFHVIAPDMRGYGNSTVSASTHSYALEQLVADLLALLSHLDRREALWIGHDWGATIVWALAAHHPDVCVGVTNMCVPYRTLELGLDTLISLVDRSIYPETAYPNGQFDYQVYYEKNHAHATKAFEANPGNSIKAIYIRGNPALYGKPGRTSTLTRDGGWFGGAAEAPDIPLSMSVLDEELHASLTESMAKTGFAGATAYYLNHAANASYTKSAVNNGVLDLPALFIEARFDAVCATATSDLSRPMRKFCTRLTECSVEAGHWVALERAAEVNAALARWIVTALPEFWPGFWKTPFVVRPARL